MFIPPRDYRQKHYFLLEISADKVAGLLQQLPELNYEHPSRAVDKYHVFSVHKDKEAETQLLSLEQLKTLHGEPERLQKRESGLSNVLADAGVRSVHMLPPKRLVHRAPVSAVDSSMEPIENAKKDFRIDDPIFPEQWHILNPNFPGHDVNVVPVWKRNITGSGVVTALVDDGLDYESPDLASNFCKEGSYDYNDNGPLPKPRLSDDYHGTRCAAEIAAAKGNGYCGVGVAYDSKVSGIRILSGEITSEDEAIAMIHGLDVNDIYSCSWGPPDDGQSMDVPEKVVREAILKGIQEGRKEKGALYVFASGNGGYHNDNCNFDGYTNSIYSITVTSIDHKGLHPPYAESCTAVMVSTYSSGSGEHIHTTDINNQCTAAHGGTSAAAPLAAGIYALILQANPDLTWRDVQALTVKEATEVNSNDPSWQNSYIEGRRYSPVFGWGKLDADRMVRAAQNWTLLKPQAWYYSPVQHANKKVDNVGSVTTTFEVTSEDLVAANLERIEHVTVTVNIAAERRGDVEVTLVSPNGIKSDLGQSRKRDRNSDGFRNWTFSSVAHWGEPGPGNWTLEVRNTNERNKLTFENWQLRLFGESLDPKKAKRFSLDEDYSDTQGDHKDTTVIAASSTLSIAPTVTSTIASTDQATPSAETGDGVYRASDTHYEEYFVFFLALGFIICIWMLKSRKKPGRARRRDEYEFDIIQPEDDFDSEYAQSQRSASIGELSNASVSRMAAMARNSLDASKLQANSAKTATTSRNPKSDSDYLRQEDQERERLYNTFNGLEEDDDMEGESMYRITSHDSA
ncbi:hypothetical protein KL938_004858 [Ogataea parapolymorpha]|nr:hypothetical protein KL938_004858 [Ogataea parapolymorpha]